jgi:16S rRNA (cytidine1402-2'-O)-methyltransferase
MSLGTLYIVATPIGNLEDLSFRAIELLKKVDLIAAEDTRHSAKLLNHFNINTKKMRSLHEYNEAIKTDYWIEQLQKGLSVALISDAGTPLISDPGYHLVRAVREQKITVIPIPGPCAAIAALSAAGLPSDRFVFEGFLPAKSVARRERLTLLQFESRTLIFYEAPHRFLDVLQDMIDVMGENRYAVIARELTKIFEDIQGNTLKYLLTWFSTHTDQQCGEFVILLEGYHREKEGEQISSRDLQILNLLLKELPSKQAVKLASKITGQRKNILYDMACDQKKQIFEEEEE